MKTMKGPALFLAQFGDDIAPFNSLPAIAKWSSEQGYEGIQMPSWDKRLFDLEKAAGSVGYCDEVKGVLADAGLQLTELSTHLQGQLVAVHPAYDLVFDDFAAPEVRGNPAARQQWAVQQMHWAAKASANLGLSDHVTFSGALAWPYVYPWQAGCNVCFEIHPGEDLHDGVTFEMLLDRVDGHERCNMLYDPSHFLLQQLDYLAFIDEYHERIKMFHVKDAEFNPTAKQGVYGGYQSWVDRAARFRSLGDGQIDFKGIFSKLAAYDFGGWAVVEWECCLKHPEDGAREGAAFVRDHIIRVTEKAFDDFAGGETDDETNRRILGLDR